MRLGLVFFRILEGMENCAIWGEISMVIFVPFAAWDR